MSNVSIRAARAGDAEGMLVVLNPIIEAGRYTAIDRLPTIEQQRDLITGFPRDGVFHVAIRAVDGSIVGFQNVSPIRDGSTGAFSHVGVIATFVDLRLRRRGISKQLFRATLDAAKQKGFVKMFTYGFIH